MSATLYYGQHPRFAVPKHSFPKYARVGVVIVGSGVTRLVKVMYVREAEAGKFNQRLIEDKELRELLEIILLSGALD